MKAEDLLGMTKKRAQDEAEIRNYIFRIIRIDTTDFQAYPDDVRTDRVCVEIDNGRVSKVTLT